MRDIYISYVHKQVERTGDRKRYRELMQYLKKIRRYPGGKEKAAEIAENWRALYYRRNAMTYVYQMIFTLILILWIFSKGIPYSTRINGIGTDGKVCTVLCWI